MIEMRNASIGFQLFNAIVELAILASSKDWDDCISRLTKYFHYLQIEFYLKFGSLDLLY